MIDLAKRVFQIQQKAAGIIEEGNIASPHILIELRSGDQAVSPVPVDGIQPELVEMMRSEVAGYLVWADSCVRPPGSDGAGGDDVERSF